MPNKSFSKQTKASGGGWKTKEIPLNGKLVLHDDPTAVGTDYVELKHLRYTDKHLRNIGGMTKVNTTSAAGSLDGAFNYSKDLPVAEQHLLVHSGTGVYDNVAAIPAQGNLTGSLFTDTAGAIGPRFSSAPGGKMMYCNGKDTIIYSGNEIKPTGYIDTNTTNSYRFNYLEKISNSLQDVANVATIHNDSGTSTIYIGSTLKLNAINWYVKTANTTAGTAVIEEWLGSTWSAVQFPVGIGATPLDTTGKNTWSFYSTVSSSKIRSVDDAVMYWYKVTLTNCDATTVIYQVTLGAPMQQITDIWDSQYRDIGSLQYYDLSINVFNDFTLGAASKTFDSNNKSTYIDLGGLQFTAGAEAYPADVFQVIGKTEYWQDVLMTDDPDNPGQYLELGWYTDSYERDDSSLDVTAGFIRDTINHVLILHDELRAFAYSVPTTPSDPWYSAQWEVNLTGATVTAYRTDGIRTNLYFGRRHYRDGNIGALEFPHPHIEKRATSDFTSDGIYIGSFERLQGFRLSFPSGYANNVKCSLYVSYWSGENWIPVSGLQDGTSRDGKAFNKSGSVMWSPPDSYQEFKRILAGPPSTKAPSVAGGSQAESPTADLYYYKVVFSDDATPTQFIAGTATAGCRAYDVTLIPAPIDIKGFRFSLEHGQRLWLCNDTAGNASLALSSSLDTSQVFNGTDSLKQYFGDDKGLVGAVALYSRVANVINNIALFFKQSETWALDATTNADGTQSIVTPRLISGSIGCVASGTIDSADVELVQGQFKRVAIWQSQAGIMISDGTSPQEISGDIKDLFDPMKVIYVGASTLATCTGFIDPQRNEYHWIIPGDTAYVFDITRKKWYEAPRTTATKLNGGFAVYDQYGVSYPYGYGVNYIWRLDNGYTFDGEDIECSFKFGDMAINEGSIFERTTIKSTKLIAKATPAGTP